MFVLSYRCIHYILRLNQDIEDWKVRVYSKTLVPILILVVGGVALQLTASWNSLDLVSSGRSIWTVPSQLGIASPGAQARILCVASIAFRYHLQYRDTVESLSLPCFRLLSSIAERGILSQQSCRVSVPPTLLPSSSTEPNSPYLLPSISAHNNASSATRRDRRI
jgi:hypothetical protein